VSRISNEDFQKWMNSQKCKCCDTPIDMGLEAYIKGKTKKVIDIDGEKVKGYYCGDCHDYAQATLMNERFVENYNGNTIFAKDGKYSPYWECHYYFKTLEECRIRIDAKHIAVTPFGVISADKLMEVLSK
jgi:hypothetical protein